MDNGMLADALLVAGKDLRVEWRSKVAIGQIVPFACALLLVFGFALDPDRGTLAKAAPGLFWVGVLLSSTLTVQRSFAMEAGGGADVLRLSGLDPAAVFLGKAAAITVQLVLLQAVLAIGVVVLYSLPLHGFVPLLATCALATVGLASAGATYGVLAAGSRAKETLLPMLFLPVVAPVLLCAARATEYALAGSPGDAWPWLRLLGAFAVIYTAIGTVAFGPLLED